MSRLAGWLDAPIGDQPAEVAIAAMAGAAALGRDSRLVCAISTEALGASGARIEGTLSASDAVWAAIIGRPRWTMPQFAETAVREGHARALAEAYLSRGPALLECLRGSFAIAVIDRTTRRLLLAIDRLGIQT